MVDTGILLLVLGVLLYVVNELKDTLRKGSKKRKIISVLTIILFVTSSILLYTSNLKQEKYSKDAGVLSGKLENSSIIDPEIHWKNGATWTFHNSSNGAGPFGVPLDIWVEDDQLKVSTTIRNKDGQIIAEIEENEWKLNKNFILDRNFDDKSLEVIDNNGNVVFQISFDGKSVQIAGVFYDENGTGSFVEPGSDVVAFGGLGKNETKVLNIEKIFLYPSDLHRGQRK